MNLKISLFGIYLANAKIVYMKENYAINVIVDQKYFFIILIKYFIVKNVGKVSIKNA